MNPVFADSYYFIALLNPGDHGYALTSRWTIGNKRPIVTTEFVLTEVADGMAKHGRRDVFGQWYRFIARRPDFRLVSAARGLFERGMEIYLKRMDKEWTLTDCISFAVMRDMKISEALTADRHFEQAGMVPLLRPPE